MTLRCKYCQRYHAQDGSILKGGEFSRAFPADARVTLASPPQGNPCAYVTDSAAISTSYADFKLLMMSPLRGMSMVPICRLPVCELRNVSSYLTVSVWKYI
jgi:hypothetical protein